MRTEQQLTFREKLGTQHTHTHQQSLEVQPLCLWFHNDGLGKLERVAAMVGGSCPGFRKHALPLPGKVWFPVHPVSIAHQVLLGELVEILASDDGHPVPVELMTFSAIRDILVVTGAG